MTPTGLSVDLESVSDSQHSLYRLKRISIYKACVKPSVMVLREIVKKWREKICVR